uniref:Uncharacterized protein n=1 Tax=Cannabis sativa TaxID=3483 RepID=A0A803QR80_CANSA
MSQSGSKIYSPESAIPKCPKHIACPYKPKNFETQTKLEINDGRIRDYLIKSNQEETANHYSRFLQEIPEGKHRFLRDAAWPEPLCLSSIPLARPMFSPNVTVAFEPGDLEFEIISP